MEGTLGWYGGYRSMNTVRGDGDGNGNDHGQGQGDGHGQGHRQGMYGQQSYGVWSLSHAVQRRGEEP